ncbi:STAS domain-containing protein [Caulobacter sp. RL271]|uniref:STAS domain-containing protein n=1 Tax=Caulobacter segnis TaxID=88688 RepID=A0ABY4ZTM3_9CAUL|nr:STAS domain-containing protein [Caulobacter segnis]USQ95271.1 STAS domain-containing protein [Caulobacter segnis]
MRTHHEGVDLVTWAPRGELTLPFVAAQHSELRALLASSSGVEIDLEAIDDVDLAGVQILLSARLSAAAQGKSLALTKAPTAAFSAVLERGGLLESGDLRSFWRLGREG